jgi:isoleucyl-tRNA synthetase
MEQARSAKAIGASLDAKVLLHVPDATLRQTLAAMNPSDALGEIRVDALRYLFLASQVELVDSPDAIAALDYHSTTDAVTVGITTAAGQKCDRCWNYSTTVGDAADDPTICDRCVNALSDRF